MKTPLVAARVDPALLESIRTRYRFAPDTNDATVIRFALAVVAGRPDPGALARAPIGHPKGQRT